MRNKINVAAFRATPQTAFQPDDVLHSFQQVVHNLDSVLAYFTGDVHNLVNSQENQLYQRQDRITQVHSSRFPSLRGSFWWRRTTPGSCKQPGKVVAVEELSALSGVLDQEEEWRRPSARTEARAEARGMAVLASGEARRRGAGREEINLHRRTCGGPDLGPISSDLAAADPPLPPPPDPKATAARLCYARHLSTAARQATPLRPDRARKGPDRARAAERPPCTPPLPIRSAPTPAAGHPTPPRRTAAAGTRARHRSPAHRHWPDAPRVVLQAYGNGRARSRQHRTGFARQHPPAAAGE